VFPIWEPAQKQRHLCTMKFTAPVSSSQTLSFTLTTATWLVLCPAAHAQRTGENVVTAAKDAFGTSIGNERIGLYNSSEVRGFSPLDAGNVRIEGFWFDQQGTLNSRLVSGSTVHVGLTAQGYPFPAPTGIVDYQLRVPGDDLIVSVLTGAGEYAGPFVEVDAKIPIIPKRLGVAAGASYAHEEYYDGSDARVASLAVIPRFRPFDGIEIIPFWSFAASRDEQVAPYIITDGSHLPPHIPRRRYYGQPWATLDTNITNLGVLSKADLSEHWQLRAALFHSLRAVPRDHAELFEDTDADGLTQESVVADPPQHRASTGGEISLTWTLSEGPRSHRLRARALGRLRSSDIRGSSEAFLVGDHLLAEPELVAEPTFSFSERTHDRVQQWTGGLAYEGRWNKLGEIQIGIQKTLYEKTLRVPGSASSRTQTDPWLLNAAVAWNATSSLAFYAGYTRGLEENGIAPGNAANRNAVLPFILTRQMDAGLRYALTPDVRLVAGVFDLRKPYFTTDENNVFTELGEIRHQGVELSWTGEFFKRLTIVAGAVLTRPRVTGPAVDSGQINSKPVGQTSRTLRANAYYRLPWLEGLALDIGLLHTGERTASSDTHLTAPALTVLDVGARYRCSLWGRPSTFRFQMTNVTDTYGFRVMASNTFRTNNPRSISATLAIDL